MAASVAAKDGSCRIGSDEVAQLEQAAVLRGPDPAAARRKFEYRRILAAAKMNHEALNDYTSGAQDCRGEHAHAHDAAGSSIWANIDFGRCCPFYFMDIHLKFVKFLIIDQFTSS